MSVFTTVTLEQLRLWLRGYQLGVLLDIEGIAAGITNTNYFVTTTQGRYVLTLFEHNSADELPYFLDLMAHLAERGIPCPQPVADTGGSYLGEINGKPAALVSRLGGSTIEMPIESHCSQVGAVLARLHLAGKSYLATMENPRGTGWWTATAAKVMHLLPADERSQLQAELEYQVRFSCVGLPSGVIHADLFRENVLFDGDELSGLVDFYYACNDAFAYDLAIAVNDWCANTDGSLDQARLRSMMTAYREVRPLVGEERASFPDLLRAAALRFWLSRLYDLYFPQAGVLTYAKDPSHFRRVLEAHIHENKPRVW